MIEWQWMFYYFLFGGQIFILFIVFTKLSNRHVGGCEKYNFSFDFS